MKTLLLTLFGIVGLVATPLLSVSQAYAVSHPQHFSWPSLIYVGADPLLLMSPQSAVPVTTGQRNATILYDLTQELRALPVGKNFSYYLQVLEQRGYFVLSNYNDHRHWEFALEKTQQNLRLTIAYDAATKKSTMITVSGPRVAYTTKTVAH